MATQATLEGSGATSSDPAAPLKEAFTSMLPPAAVSWVPVCGFNFGRVGVGEFGDSFSFLKRPSVS